MQKFRVVCRPTQQDCVVITAPVGEAHLWIAKLLLMFRCEADDGFHQLALIQWFDWKRFDQKTASDVYELMGDADIKVLSLASIRYKVSMMPVGDEFFLNRLLGNFILEHR